MAVRSRPLVEHPPVTYRPPIAHSTLPWPIMLLTLAVLVVSLFHGQLGIWLDDLRCGRPRTTHASAVVGHSDSSAQPTKFVALNLDRRVVVLEIPGADPAKTEILVGPYLMGAQENLIPIGLVVHDRTADGKPDLTISVKGEELVYVNTGTTFRLSTPTERAALVAAGR